MSGEQKRHVMKCWPEYFQEVWDKNKPFEIRKDDRNIQAGDTILLKEWDKDKERFTGRAIECLASYVIRNNKFCKPGYCTIGLRYMTNHDKGGMWWLKC